MFALNTYHARMIENQLARLDSARCSVVYNGNRLHPNPIIPFVILRHRYEWTGVSNRGGTKRRENFKPGGTQSQPNRFQSKFTRSIHSISKMSNPSASPVAVVAEDMSCKVFVGNLSYQTRESELKDIFSKAGNV